MHVRKNDQVMVITGKDKNTKGKITVAFPTGHAYGLRTEDGLDLLMHIGMDTVELDGKHFTPKVAKGDTVKRGDVIELGTSKVTFEVE